MSTHLPRTDRREDGPLLTGLGTFIDGLRLPELDGALHAVFVRSIEPHGRLVSIDAADASAMPGVAAVLTGDDLTDVWVLPPRLPMANKAMVRPMMAQGMVRFVGEPVAVVLAESRAEAVDAAEAVIVETDPLPPVIDLDDALRGEVLLHQAAGTNVSFEWSMPPFDDRPVRRVRRGRRVHHASPAVARGRLRAARGRRGMGSRRAMHGVGVLAASGRREVRDRVRPRPGAWHGARHRARRRWRLRLEGRLRLPAGRRGRRLGGAPARPSGSLGRDALGVDALDGSRSRIHPPRADRRQPRRQGAGVRGVGDARQRRLPGHGHVHHHQPAQLRHRGLRHPDGAGQRPVGGDQHVVDHGAARCRPS